MFLIPSGKVPTGPRVSGGRGRRGASRRARRRALSLTGRLGCARCRPACQMHQSFLDFLQGGAPADGCRVKSLQKRVGRSGEWVGWGGRSQPSSRKASAMIIITFEYCKYSFHGGKVRKILREVFFVRS